MSPDRVLGITSETSNQLVALRSQPKFIEDGLYPGAPDPEIRNRCERSINTLIGRLLAGIQANPRKSYVFSEFTITLREFQQDDTEEREQACGYLEKIMDLLGIESSDGLLNTWLYGNDLGKLLE